MTATGVLQSTTTVAHGSSISLMRGISLTVVRTAVTMCVLFVLFNNLTMKKSKEKREYLQSQGYGDQNKIIPGTDGITLSDRNRYMQEHIDRVIHGEDTWEVAEELQQRYKEEQEMKQRLKRDNPAYMPEAS